MNDQYSILVCPVRDRIKAQRINVPEFNVSSQSINFGLDYKFPLLLFLSSFVSQGYSE